MAGGLRDFLDHLNAGCSGPDHGHSLACEGHGMVRPQARVVGLAGKRLHTLDLGHDRRRERADRRDQELRACPTAILENDLPGILGFVVGCAGDPAIELDVPPQVEPVGDEFEVAERFRLRGEMLPPIPFLQNLRREGIAIGVTLRIEPRSRIAIPVPGAAHAATGLEDPDRYAELSEAIELVHAGHAGTDDDDVISPGRRIARGGFVLLRHGPYPATARTKRSTSASSL